MNESKLTSIDALNQELGAVRAYIALIPQLNELRKQCVNIKLALRKKAINFALDEVESLQHNLTLIINAKPGGAR